MRLISRVIIEYIADNYPDWSTTIVANNIHIINRQFGCIIILNIDSMKGKSVIEPSDSAPNGTKFTTVRLFQCNDSNLLQSISEQIDDIKSFVDRRNANVII
jgi:hypothetical protein